MKQILKTLFPQQALHYKAYKSLIENKRSYLYLTGWMQSLQEAKPIDKNGIPIPWMNFPVIKLLKKRLKDDFILFEFGSGYSTYFYANKVRSVTSVEYDEKWFKLVKANMPANVELIFKEKDINGHYCRVVGSMGKQFDVVVVDGWDRVNCVKQAIPALSSRGVILLDDSLRNRYQEGIEFAQEKGFRRLDLEGLKPPDNGIYSTAILYRDGNCLGI